MLELLLSASACLSRISVNLSADLPRQIEVPNTTNIIYGTKIYVSIEPYNKSV
jgi:hypothetical protein